MRKGRRGKGRKEEEFGMNDMSLHRFTLLYLEHRLHTGAWEAVAG